MGDPADPLLPGHRADLAASGLSDDTVRALGFHSVADPDEVARILRWRGRGRAAALGPCLAIPFPGPDGAATDYVRLKPSHPRETGGRRVKYESPVGRPNRAFVPPGTRAALADPAVPLVVTEGEKKAAKADQDGFPCVGLVGVYGWAGKREAGPGGRKTPFRLVPDLAAVAWAGRVVYLAYDSDLADKPDVRWAEWRLCEALGRAGADVRSVRLPPGPDGAKVGLDDFLVAEGPAALTARLAAAAPTTKPTRPAAHHPATPRTAGRRSEPGPPATGGFAEDHDNPHRLADVILDGPPFDHPDGPALRYWNEEFAEWDGGAYRRVPDAEFRARAATRIRTQLEADARADFLAWTRADPDRRSPAPPKAKKVTRALVGDVAQALAGRTLVRGAVRPPAWLTATPRPPARDLIAAPNGLIHLPAVAAGRPDCLLPHTPTFFTFNRLAFPFDPAAPPPARWLAFLRTVWPDDPECVAALQEWFGYLLTVDTSHQKILVLRGPPRSGKGTILRVIDALVGEENAVSPTLAGLATNFGLAPLLGKTVATVGDARLGDRADVGTITERLLTISGEDAVTVDRKYLQPVTVRLPTRFVIACNLLPRFMDASTAIVTRLVVLRFRTSFLGREDRGLLDALRADLPGILVWAIAGWTRLAGRGRFTQPASGRDEIAEAEGLSSPVIEFVRDECVVGPAERVGSEELYDRWKGWCLANDKKHGSPQLFGRNLRAAGESLGCEIDRHRPRVGGGDDGGRWDRGRDRHRDPAPGHRDQPRRSYVYYGVRLLTPAERAARGEDDSDPVPTIPRPGPDAGPDDGPDSNAWKCGAVPTVPTAPGNFAEGNSSGSAGETTEAGADGNGPLPGEVSHTRWDRRDRGPGRLPSQRRFSADDRPFGPGGLR